MSRFSTEDISSGSIVSSNNIQKELVMSGASEVPEPTSQKSWDDTSELGEVGPASFSFLDNLGEGAFGQVFLAQHKSTGKSYAMKACDRGAAQAMETANAERVALWQVNPHPYIVRLFASFETETRSVLVLEYCSGGDLQHLINWDGRLSEPLARLYAAEMLLALGHVHNCGLAFRDVKPENVLLDSHGHARLTDFGLASPLQETEQEIVVGTPAFMAPELIDGNCLADFGRMADIYGLGVLLFNMLSGALPFSGRSRKQLFENIRMAPLGFPAKFGSELAMVLVRDLMQRDPALRMGAAQTELVQKHAFFADIDFQALMRHEVSVPAPARRKSFFSRLFGSAN